MVSSGLTVSLPFYPTPGNYLTLLFVGSAALNTYTINSGFSLLWDNASAGVGTGPPYPGNAVLAFGKTIQIGDSTDYSLAASFLANTGYVWAAIEWSNDVSFRAAAQLQAFQPAAMPTIHSVPAGSVDLFIIGGQTSGLFGSNNTPFVPPADLTPIFHQEKTGGLGFFGGAAGWRLQPSLGDTPAETYAPNPCPGGIASEGLTLALNVGALTPPAAGLYPVIPLAGCVPFEVQTVSALLDEGRLALLQRVYIDINCNGETLTPTILVDNSDYTQAAITNAARGTIEIAFQAVGREYALRLTGCVNHRVELFGIDNDIATGDEPQ